MHFSVMVPVKCKVSEVDTENAREAAARLESIEQQVIPPTKEDNLMSKIMFDHLVENLKMRSQAFSSSALDALDEAMYPYAQELEDEELMEFEDETDDLKHSYENDSTKAILSGGKYYHLYGLKGFEVKDDVVYEKHPTTGALFRSPKARQMTVVEVPNNVRWKTFKAYAKENASAYDSQTKKYGYWHNPRCFWDWYVVGGRWGYALLVKEDCETCLYGGAPSGGPLDVPPAPEGYKWVDGARKCDLELEKMAEAEIESVTKKFRSFEEMWKKQTIAPGQYLNLQSDGIYSFRTKVYDPSMTLESVLADKNISAKTILASIFHGYLKVYPWDDIKSGDDGYWNNDMVNDWTEDFNAFYDTIEDDDVIIVVDCHM